MTFSFNQIANCVSLVQAMIREKEVRYVNSGGCGVFASLLAKKLTSLGIPEEEVKIINYCMGGGSYDVCEAEQAVRSEYGDEMVGTWQFWTNYLPGMAHVRVCWQGHIFDAEERTDTLANNRTWGWSNELCNGHFSHEAMQLLAEEDDWNPVFDRSQIPILEKIIDKAFESLV